MKTINKIRILSLLSLLAILFVTGCCVIDPIEDDDADHTFTRDFEQIVPVENQTILRVEGINGKIWITGTTDPSQASVYAERKVKSFSYQDAEEQMEHLSVEITTGDSYVKIRSVHPNSTHDRTYTIDYRIEVPGDWMVQIVNMNGEVFVDSVRNDVSVNLTNGNITLDDHEGNIICGLTNGNIQVESELPQNGSWTMAITNGQMIVRLPASTSATLSASITNGTISTQNLVLSDKVSTRHSTQGRLNDGEGTINLSVVNGQINLEGTG